MTEDPLYILVHTKKGSCDEGDIHCKGSVKVLKVTPVIVEHS